jgi:3-deoxy-D-manno-octulosonate 8-phosphate phosphatase (KDO 8-P phosphatase)
MADDVYDISLLKTVGVPITVPNAHNEVKKHVKYITKNFGGNGAVREIIDLIIE